MAFIRQFDTGAVNNLDGETMELYQKLIADVKNGCVFPAIRDGCLDFYYAGGVLFRLLQSGRFERNDDYSKYGDGTADMDYYEKCKKQNENRWINDKGDAKERQVLDRLNSKTFIKDHGKVVVFDIEVRINEDNGNQCDMVLLNTDTSQLMFVEGKLYENSDMYDGANKGVVPPVVLQVCGYTQTIATYKDKIEAEYRKHISIANELFGSSFKADASLVLPAKLLVYSSNKSEHSGHATRTSANKLIDEYICKRNIMWNFAKEPSLDEMWEYFTASY